MAYWAEQFQQALSPAVALVNAATKGDVGAANEIFDRIDGKLRQAVTGEGGTGSVELRIRRLPPDEPKTP